MRDNDGDQILQEASAVVFSGRLIFEAFSGKTTGIIPMAGGRLPGPVNLNYRAITEITAFRRTAEKFRFISTVYLRERIL